MTSQSVTRRFKQNIPLFIMLAPVLLFYIVFRYLPMAGLVIAFKNYNFTDGILHSPWVGLQYFEWIFTNSQTLSIIRNTLTLSLLTVIVSFPFPIMLAILLNEARKMWFKRAVQTLVYLPHFFSWVIVGGIVVTIFSQQSGMINHMLERWLGEPYPFLYDETSWIAIFLGSGVWKEAGFSAIIYLAALSTIDSSLYEASSLDGAGKFRQIWHVTLPGIRSTIILLLILSMGQVMEVGFDKVFVLQNNAVANVSEVISTYIYKTGLQSGQFSLAAAVGFFESIVGLVLIVTANRIARRFDQQLW
ncbi:ABC transporter permease subunit [Paenibacillus sp. J5C_2022]|uniref:ABC transporter permease n=1 Tax=Paenibacillus sp. J5C2022 TaxID=2977129 RepID=UPI0021D35191|nr:ABC transporter permease subunit [Paenibacillus sp. J5C2022]MCU6712030.1 ABC transporter permease subunit [Paenibacillus sp. J5C2022]